MLLRSSVGRLTVLIALPIVQVGDRVDITWTEALMVSAPSARRI